MKAGKPKINTSIQEGALINGQFLPEEEFKNVLLNQIKDRREEIINRFEEIEKFVEGQNYQQAYDHWEKIQVEILKTPKTQMLAILDFYSSGNQEWRMIESEVDLISDKTGMINTQLGQEIKNLQSATILASHLSGMFKSLQQIPVDIAGVKKKIGEELKDPKALNEINNSNRQQSFKNLIWTQSEQSSFKYRGQVADAYVNHLGRFHSQLLNPTAKTLKSHLSKSVYNEEGEINLTQMLIDAKNNTGWWTGGDLILRDENNYVIYNIQVKTSGSKGEQIGKISLGRFKKRLNKVKEQLISDNSGDLTKSLDAFYQMVKTTSIQTIETQTKKEIENLVQENLTK